jgi:glycosyltransferase involved in cell wall biosynthesis
MRVLHCPSCVGGNSWTLSRAERTLGIESDVMVHSSDWTRYPVDIDLHLENRSRIEKIGKLLSFLVKAAGRYDVFHFNFGNSILPYSSRFSFFDLADLPVLRSLGKKIVVTYQGCDIRQKGFSTQHFPTSACALPDCYGGFCNNETDFIKRKRSERFARYAHRIYALNPDLLHVLPSKAEFLPYASVDISQWQPTNNPLSNKITILHSPTNRTVKGTKYIVEAISKLKEIYSNVDFMLIENIPHNQVQDLYQKADIAIDQLLIGWYGGFAVEMMALAKPVICYIREEDLKFIPPEMKTDLPLINANPENMFNVLKQTMEAREKWKDIGLRSRAYVEKWHDPLIIATKLKAVYESI